MMHTCRSPVLPPREQFPAPCTAPSTAEIVCAVQTRGREGMLPFHIGGFGVSCTSSPCVSFSYRYSAIIVCPLILGCHGSYQRVLLSTCSSCGSYARKAS